MNQKPYFAEIELNITTHISMTAMNRKHLFPEIVMNLTTHITMTVPTR